MPEINRETPIPLYYQVSQIIKREIESGKYSPGDYIPTEQELRNRFVVSRATIRQAISELIYQGLLERRRTKGTIVAKQHIEATLKDLASFTSEIMGRDQTLSTKILTFRHIQCPANVAEFLDISTTDIVARMERLRFVDDMPMAIEKWYAPLKYFPDLSQSMFGETGFEQSTYVVLLNLYNIKITRAVDTVSAVDLEEHDARLLKQDVGASVLLRTRVSYSADGYPVTYASGLYAIKLKFALETSSSQPYTKQLENE
jgi:GntR family transcriptional regulator